MICVNCGDKRSSMVKRILFLRITYIAMLTEKHTLVLIMTKFIPLSGFGELKV